MNKNKIALCEIRRCKKSNQKWFWPKLLRVGNNVFGDPKEFDDPQVSDSLKVISSECVDFDDSKEFDDPKAFDDPKGISIGSMDFDNPKVYDESPSSVVLFCKKKRDYFGTSMDFTFSHTINKFDFPRQIT